MYVYYFRKASYVAQQLFEHVSQSVWDWLLFAMVGYSQVRKPSSSNRVHACL